MRAVWIAVLAAPGCSLLFDARNTAEHYDDGFQIPPTPIVRFEAIPASVRLGDTALLAWETDGVDDVAIREDGVRISNDRAGVRIVQPSRTTEYTIDAQGTTQGLTLFVDEAVPPEILDFAISPPVLTQNVVAAWDVSHGAVSLLAGTELMDGLDPSGSLELRLDRTTEIGVFVFGAGSAGRRQHAFAVETPNLLTPDAPHPIRDNAVRLDPIPDPQYLTWTQPGTLLPTIVDPSGDCADASIRISVLPEDLELATLESCDHQSITAPPVPVQVMVTLRDLPGQPIFVPEWRETGCGNGIVEDNEECDDYDLYSGDGCDAQCRFEDAALLADPLDESDLDEPPIEAQQLELVAYENSDGAYAMV